jgi:hypothetical protein
LGLLSFAGMASSPISAVGLSLAKLEIARALQDVDDLVARTNKKLTSAGQDELPRAYYSADEMSLVLQRHEQELDALRPTPPKSAWEQWKASGQSTTSKPGGASDFAPFAAALVKARGDDAPSSVSLAAALDMVEASLKDDRLSLEAMCECLAPVIRLCRRPPPTDAARRHIASWLDGMVAAWAASPAPDVDGGDLADDEDDELLPADAGPREASLAPARIVAAIEDGTVIPIGRAARGERKES